MSVFLGLRRIFLAATVVGVSALAAAVPVVMKSSPADAAAPPTYAYLSSENGHFSHVVNTSTQSWVHQSAISSRRRTTGVAIE